MVVGSGLVVARYMVVGSGPVVARYMVVGSGPVVAMVAGMMTVSVIGKVGLGEDYMTDWEGDYMMVTEKVTI